VNQQIATFIAFVFILLVGVFNIAYAASNLWKKRARKGLLTFRLIIGFLIFCIAIAFGYFFIWMKQPV
jgi:putative copper export protein